MRRASTVASAGRFRRLGDLGAKARAFPGGAARARLRLAVRMTSIDEIILTWLGGAARRPDKSAAEVQSS